MPAKLICNGRFMMALVMFLIFVTMVGFALGYPAQARFMPLVVGLPGIGFTLLELIKETRRALNVTNEPESSGGDSNTIALPDDVSRLIGQESVTVQGETPQMTPAELQKREKILLVYVTAMIAALIVFGFWITVPAFVGVFLREREKASWRMALGSAGAVLAVLYFVFYRGLGIDLHTGFITQWAWDILFPPE